MYCLIGGQGLQNKIKMRMPPDFSHFNCLRNNEFYLCDLKEKKYTSKKKKTKVLENDL